MTPLLNILTAREEAVLVMLGDGLGLREIAERLGMTERSARRARDRGRCKLDAPTTTAAVVMVTRMRSLVGVG